MATVQDGLDLAALLEKGATDIRADAAQQPTHGAIGDGTIIKLLGPLFIKLLENPAIQQMVMQFIIKLLGGLGSTPGTTPTVPAVPGTSPWGATP